MKPEISHTSFGSITVGGQTFEHDIVIGLDAQVRKRNKKLSKKVFGTSHTLSLAEAQDVYQPGAARLVFGSGQAGLANLSDEAAAFFQAQGCQVVLQPTPQASETWNESAEKTIGLFHITC